MTQDEMRRGQAHWESNRRSLAWLTLGISELFYRDEDHDKYQTELSPTVPWWTFWPVVPARVPYGNPLKKDKKR